MDDWAAKFAVVRTNNSQNMCFTVWHDTLELAKAEAERLAKLSGGTFVIMQTVGYMRPTTPPVEWRECEPARNF